MNQTQMKALGIGLIVVAVALGVTGVLLARQPVLVWAAALVKVERDKIDLPELAGLPGLAAAAAAGTDNTYFIQTEIAVIQSDATLNQVMTQLNLSQVWGERLNRGNVLQTSETSQLLKERLQVQPGSDVGFIYIKAASDVAAEAAAIANASAQAYCQYRIDYRRRLAQTALDTIAGKYADMEKQIAAGHEKVEQAWQQLDPALRELAATNSTTAESETLRGLHARHSELLLRHLTASNQLAMLQRTNRVADEIIEQLKARAEKAKVEMTAAEEATQHEMLRLDLLKKYQAARFELEELNQRFAPVKKKTEELRNDLRPQAHTPASVVESAMVPTVPDTRNASSDRWILPSAGVAFILGIGLILFGRKPKKSAA